MLNDNILRSGTPEPSGPAAVGDLRNGGIVIYVDPADNTHGIVASVDYEVGTSWTPEGSYFFNGATGTAIGTGASNTSIVVANQGATAAACYLASTYSGGGYNDWYLPSLNEAQKLNTQYSFLNGILSANGLTLLTANNYWTSSEISTTSAYSYWGPNSCCNAGRTKKEGARIRPCRTF